MKKQRVKQIKKYFNIQVMTASASKTVCFVHEQCVFLLHQALAATPDIRRPILNKVQNLIVLLERSLIISDPTSKSLLLLYDYCYSQLEIESDRHCMNTLKIIEPLHATFKTIIV